MIVWRNDKGELEALTEAEGPDREQIRLAEEMKAEGIAPAGCEYWINQQADGGAEERARLEADLPMIPDPIERVEVVPVLNFTPAEPPAL